MSPSAIIFLISAAILVFGCYHIFMTRSAIVKGAIEKVPQKKISEVSEGEMVSIKGKVILIGKSLRAPLSKRKCAYYSVKVQSRQLFGSDITEERGGDLVLEEEGYYALVNVNKVEALLHDDESYSYDAWPSSIVDLLTNSDELKNYMKKQGKMDSLFDELRTDVHATEGVLEDGETVVVAGKASWKKPSKFMLNIKADKILYIEPLNEHGVYVSEDLF